MQVRYRIQSQIFLIYRSDDATTEEQTFPIHCDLTLVPRDSIEETGSKPLGRYLKFNVKVEIEVRDKVYVRVRSAGKDLVEPLQISYT